MPPSHPGTTREIDDERWGETGISEDLLTLADQALDRSESRSTAGWRLYSRPAGRVSDTESPQRPAHPSRVPLNPEEIRARSGDRGVVHGGGVGNSCSNADPRPSDTPYVTISNWAGSESAVATGPSVAFMASPRRAKADNRPVASDNADQSGIG